MLFNLWQKKGSSSISRWFDCVGVWVSYGLMLNEENLHFIRWLCRLEEYTIPADWLGWIVGWLNEANV